MSKRKQKNDMPTFDKLIVPTAAALVQLGGSGTVDEINTKVYEIANISDAILQIPHGTQGSINEIDYRLAWSRTYLKKFGLLENSSRGIWALSKSDIDLNSLDHQKIVKYVRTYNKEILSKDKNFVSSEIEQTLSEIDKLDIDKEIEIKEDWKEILLNMIYEIPPATFERLAQRILRESGFVQVEVTGKSGDGGIDGKGILKVNGLLGFNVVFQCKRYKGSITPNQIRDFRGAMQGRADKAIFITSGKFTRDAIKEANRDGVPRIDLIDGDLLCDKLKEFNLGVETKLIEQVYIKNEWFNNL